MNGYVGAGVPAQNQSGIGVLEMRKVWDRDRNGKELDGEKEEESHVRSGGGKGDLRLGRWGLALRRGLMLRGRY